MSDDRLPGREAELAEIGEAIGRAAAGTPTAVLIEGEPGGGKTALLRLLEDSPLLPRRRIRVVSLDLAEGGDPVLLAAASLTHHATFARLGGRRRTFAALRKVLPDWIGAIPGWGDLLEAITSTAAALRRRRGEPKKVALPEEMEELHEAARRRAAAVLLDGAEGVGAAEAERLFRLLDTAEVGTRFLVIAACRPAAPGAPAPPIARAIGRLPQSRRARIVLRPLNREAVEHWLEGRLGGSVSPALLDTLMDATGGLPRAIDERIRALQARDALRRVEEGWIEVARATDAPATEEADAAQVDLGPLDDDVRHALAAGALLGDTFAALDVSRVLERDELWVEDRLASATRLGVLHLVDDAHEVDGDITSLYRFTSAAVRAALRRSITPERRAVLQAKGRSA